MKNKKQMSLFKNDLRFFGGGLLYRKRKNQRPLSRKDAIHLVMRSSWARGRYSFLRRQHLERIKQRLEHLRKKYGVRIYRSAIASNHIHLVLKIESRESYKAFVRVFASQVAQLVMNESSFEAFQKRIAGDGSQRKSVREEIQGKGQKFWQFRPFTRILNWGRDFQSCTKYVVQNQLEAFVFIPYSPRKNLYSRWFSAPGNSRQLVSDELRHQLFNFL